MSHFSATECRIWPHACDDSITKPLKSVGTLRTRYSIHTFYILPKNCIHVFCTHLTKYHYFPRTELTDRLLLPRRYVHCAVRIHLIIQVNILVLKQLKKCKSIKTVSHRHQIQFLRSHNLARLHKKTTHDPPGFHLVYTQPTRMKITTVIPKTLC